MDFSRVLVVLAIAASPISELRGAIPIAIIQFHFPWYYAFLLAVIGNLLPVPLILIFLDTFSRLLNKIGSFAKMLHWFSERTKRRGKLIERYGWIGLVLFVAVPLPVTGAWTGSFAAVLFGLKFKQAFFSILVGILIAGTIVTCATLLGWTIFGLWTT
ncbi:COG2426 family protein [Chloroflexota bacterium]